MINFFWKNEQIEAKRIGNIQVMIGGRSAIPSRQPRLPPGGRPLGRGHVFGATAQPTVLVGECCQILPNFAKLCQTFEGSLSAVSKPMFASKYSFESSCRDLQDFHTSAPFESNLKTKKSASGKRHPDEAHSSGKETSRPQQCSKAWRK